MPMKCRCEYRILFMLWEIYIIKSLCHLDDVALDTGALIERWYTSDGREHKSTNNASARE